MKLNLAPLALALSFCATTAQANSELIAWRWTTREAFTNCSQEMISRQRIANMKREPGVWRAALDRTRECANQALIDGKQSTKAILSLKFSPKVRGLVKDYYAIWNAGVETLPELIGETERESRRATMETQSSLAQIWALIEIEIEMGS